MGIKVNIIMSALIDGCIQSEFIQMRGRGKKRKGKLVEGGYGVKSETEGQTKETELHSDIMAGGCRVEMKKCILPRIHSEKHTTNRDK